jgi:hypothetical protein
MVNASMVSVCSRVVGRGFSVSATGDSVLTVGLASAVGCRRESSAGYLDIEGEEAMSFFGRSEGDAEESQG